MELSTRDPEKAGDFIGTAEDWANAEGALREVLASRGLQFKTFPGEAAFYGPKIDVKLVDVLGRLWQLSTVQFDFNLPARFELDVHGRGWRAAPAGDGASRAVRVGGAVLWGADRALCGGVSVLAGTGAGGGGPDLHGQAPGVCPRGVVDRLRGGGAAGGAG